MSNLSKQRRDKMIAALDELKSQSNEEQKKIILDIKNELLNKKYGLVWEEHQEKVDLELEQKIPVFREDEEKKIVSYNEDSFNFLLEGDNLHSLYLLEKTHRNKIDVIYIDPPYNRGKNDFIYDDNFITEEDTFRHSKWLSFMAKRLRIARELLSQTGLIFISIDDNEYSNLKLLCEEIFGEGNFINSFVWQRSSSVKTEKEKFTVSTEYVLLFSKSDKYVLNDSYKPLADSTIKTYNKDDKDGRGKYASISLQKPKDPGPETTYDYIDETGKIWKCPNNGWRMTFSKIKELELDNRLILDGNTLRVKDYWNERKSFGKRIDTLWNDLPENTKGSSELKEVLGQKNAFNNPKPTGLIKRCLEISHKEAVVLDFFAGSGTTGHAVIDLNNEDGGTRKFILCTNNEGGIYENVTYPRLKTIITGVRKDGTSFGEGTRDNLKCFRTAWIDRKSQYLEDELTMRIFEMIELENHIEIDNKKYVVIMSEADAQKYLDNTEISKKIVKVWHREDVLFTSEQLEKLKDIDVRIIPRNYFDVELKEGGYYA